jgi:hypothetical protein
MYTLFLHKIALFTNELSEVLNSNFKSAQANTNEYENKAPKQRTNNTCIKIFFLIIIKFYFQFLSKL